jgi:acylphosphatase
MNNRRVRVIVSGRVQGVFFRESTRQAAERAKVRGWIKNLPDGRVEALLEGPQDGLLKVLDYMKQGPEYAEVSDAQVVGEEYQGEFKGFTILRK